MKLKKSVKISILVAIITIIIIIAIILIKGIKKEEKVKEPTDNTIPIIRVLNEKIYIDGDTEFDPAKNIEAKFGKTGGKVTCTKELKVGTNTIVCTATGKNKLSTKANYEVIMSKTYHKNAIFFGDSIVSGFAARGYSWANYIGDNYDLSSSVNAGIMDYRLSTYDNPNKWLVTEVKSHYSDQQNYDFVILQGGVNDVIYNTPIGSISQSKDINSFDPKTFCGGLESYLYHVTNKWGNSRIGYIITYYTPNYTERGLKWSYNDYKKYNDKAIEILNKWNIKYINFATDEFNNILKVEERTYLPDYLHLNSQGYKIISPYIYNFMQTLDKYKQ